ncbi:MAG TPA: hypothetical protein VGP94_15650 [Tepidisphaeraceae bacterium]|nr:hypothetical protein [Tepidisphaeraceae bacterium]
MPLEVPALFPPLVPLFDDPALFPLVDDPALFAPLERSELVPLFVRVRSVSLVLDPVFVLLGRVVGSFVVVPGLVSRVRVFVPVSLLSHPTNAIPPNAKAAATRIP